MRSPPGRTTGKTRRTPRARDPGGGITDGTHRPHRGRSRLLLAIVVGLLLWWLNATIAQWSNHTFVFVSATGFALAVLLLAAWVVAAVGPSVWRFLRSVAGSMLAGAARDPEVLRLEARYPRTAGWLRRRLTLSTWSGLYLTITVALSAYFLLGFLSIARQAIAASLLASYDTQLSALLRAFRTPTLTRFLWLFTILGDARVAAVMTAAVVALLLVWGRRAEAVLVGVAVGGGLLLGQLTRGLVHRARPDLTFALVKEPSSFSLPSGHALYALLFWGVLAFLLIRLWSRTSWRISVFGVGTAIVVLTGLSRVYLGVHWPSDVLASWLLALGWLTACIGAYLMWERYGRPREGHAIGAPGVRYGLVALAIVAGISAVWVQMSSDGLLKQATASPPSVEWTTLVNAEGLPAPTAEQAQALPHVSEKLDGTPAEPVGLIFVGTQQQLTEAFLKSGWSVADLPSTLTLLHALVAAYSNEAYATGPVTPSFIAGQVQNISFEKPEGQPTIRRRHHNRWWQTRFTFRGRPVWVATASFDTSLEIGSTIPVLTHHIAPDIDAEQAYAAGDLESAGVRLAARVRVAPPSSGSNAQGDRWFTQGMATVLVAP